MRVVCGTSREALRFNEIKRGSVFMASYTRSVFIKTSEVDAVRVVSGVISEIDRSTSVIPKPDAVLYVDGEPTK